MTRGTAVARVAALGVLWMASVGAVVGDVAARKAEQAAEAYAGGDYQKALKLYRDAQVEKPGSAALHFNVGDALYKTGKTEEALRELEQVAASSRSDLRAQALYNMGNVYMQQRQIGRAVKAYRRALELQPHDREAKANLELALKLQQLQQQQQQQQRLGNQKEGDQQSDQRKQPGAQDEQQQQEQRKDQKREQGQQNRKQDAQGKDGQDQSRSPGSAYGQEQAAQQPDSTLAGPGERMDSTEAQRLLDALRDREKQAQIHRMGPPEGSRGKDW